MWSLFSSNNTRADVQRLTRRIVDSTAGRDPYSDQRADNRIVRQLPVFVAAYDSKGESIGDVSGGLTKDISDDGMALFTTTHVVAAKVIVALLVDGEPKFLKGTVHVNRPFGAGLWQLGIEVTEIIDPYSCPAAAQMLQLIPYLSS